MSGIVRDLAIIGSGGFAREVADLVRDINQVKPIWNLIGLVAKDEKNRNTIEGFPIIENEEKLFELKNRPYIAIGIADTEIKKSLVEKFEKAGFRFAKLIHPSVTILGETTTIGDGTILCANVLLAINVQVGKHCLINFNSLVGHDTVVCDYVSLMPHTAIAGESRIGKGCWFGINSTCINRVNIGEWSTYGAGTVITKDMPDNITAVGVPAKIIKYHDK